MFFVADELVNHDTDDDMTINTRNQYTLPRNPPSDSCSRSFCVAGLVNHIGGGNKGNCKNSVVLCRYELVNQDRERLILQFPVRLIQGKNLYFHLSTVGIV